MLVLYVANLPKSWSVFISCSTHGHGFLFHLMVMGSWLSCPGLFYLLTRYIYQLQFLEHDVSNAVDELLSKVRAGLTEDGIQLVKTRVLESALGFFDATFTSNKYLFSQFLFHLPTDTIHAREHDGY